MAKTKTKTMKVPRYDEQPCAFCGTTCSGHPDAGHAIAYCGDCGRVTCMDHRVEDDADRCVECAATFYATPAPAMMPVETQKRLMPTRAAALVLAGQLRAAGAVRVRIADSQKGGSATVFWRPQAGSSVVHPPAAAAPALRPATPPLTATPAALAVRRLLGRAPRVRPLTPAPAGFATVPCAKCGRLNAKNPAARPDCQSAAACARRAAAAASVARQPLRLAGAVDGARHAAGKGGR